MLLSIIVAQSENRIIGRENKLPWYLPEDLKYFKRITQGKPIVMGRKTYESIGRPLPGRTNIVISRNVDYQSPGVHVVSSLDQALELAEQQALIDGSEEMLVIGGAEIYKQAIQQADRLYVTQVHATIDGDAVFPEIDNSVWKEVLREDFFAEGPNPYDYSFVVFQRKNSEEEDV